MNFLNFTEDLSIFFQLSGNRFGRAEGKNIMTSVCVGINRETNRGKNQHRQNNTTQPLFVA